jgi:hypothetical protein
MFSGNSDIQLQAQTNDTTIFVSNTGSGGLAWNIDSTNSATGTSLGGGRLAFFAGSSYTHFVLDGNTQRVGIGTGSPSSVLEVSGSANTAKIRATQTGAGNYSYASNAANNSGTYYHFDFEDAGVMHGSITSNGTNVAYNTASDQRLKIDSGVVIDLSCLRSVRVHDFLWKDSKKADRGVFAQEVIELFPNAVTRPEHWDGVWQVDYSKFVADLIAGWQNHDARLQRLEEKAQPQDI